MPEYHLSKYGKLYGAFEEATRQALNKNSKNEKDNKSSYFTKQDVLSQTHKASLQGINKALQQFSQGDQSPEEKNAFLSLCRASVNQLCDGTAPASFKEDFQELRQQSEALFDVISNNTVAPLEKSIKIKEIDPRDLEKASIKIKDQLVALKEKGKSDVKPEKSAEIEADIQPSVFGPKK